MKLQEGEEASSGSPNLETSSATERRSPPCRGGISTTKAAARPYLLYVLVASMLLLYILFHQTNNRSDSSSQQEQQTTFTHRRLKEEPEATLPSTHGSTFLGFPIEYHAAPSSYASTVHCVGENFGPDAWKYRSCQFRNLCFDTLNKEFLLFPSPEELALQDLLNKLHSDLITISSVSRSNDAASKTTTLSLGTVRAQEGHDEQTKWFPEVVSDLATQRDLLAKGYYQLPDDVAFFPFQPSPAAGFGAWSDVFSVYTVLSMFGLDGKRPALLQHDSADNGAFPTALLPVLGIKPTNFASSRDASLEISNDTRADHNNDNTLSHLVCAKYGAAGLGMISVTRQSTAGSGDAPILTHAVARGTTLAAFRAYALRNLGGTTTGTVVASEAAATVPSGATTAAALSPCTITLAFESSTSDVDDDNDWSEQVRAHLARSLSMKDSAVVVRSVNARGVHIKELTQLAATSTVYIAAAGAERTLAAATFLPHGTALVILDGVAHGSSTGSGATEKRRSERDILAANAVHVRLHWLTRQTVELDVATLARVVGIVRNALDSLIRSG